MRREVRADEAQGRALQHELDRDATLVAVHAQQPRALAPNLHARDVTIRGNYNTVRGNYNTVGGES